jgi:hypothetical protein
MLGERIIDYYVLVYDPSHVRAVGGGYVPEQILVAEKVLERSLTQDEDVRHIDGDTKNNAPENLEVVSTNSGFRVIALVDNYVSKPRRITTKTFIPCKFQRKCWKEIRQPKARKLKCYLPYICSYQEGADVIECPLYWDFLNSAQETDKIKEIDA